MTNKIRWNWQQKDWPEFSYNTTLINRLESLFLRDCGIFLGSYRHITEEEKITLIVDLMSDEALNTSEIEGEILNRESVQSSIRRNFGLHATAKKSSPAEQGIADMMVDVYQNFTDPLTDALLCKWHKMLMKDRSDIEIGQYRTHQDAMQVVSGALHNPKIHFEAPPSAQVKKEMSRFIIWFNNTAPDGKNPLPALARASMAHLYFVCIHPFEDGNGRIGRAIVEKSLSQSIGHPMLTGISGTIQGKRKDYYNMLEASNKSNAIDTWLEYFSKTILAAQKHTIESVDFLIEKTKFYDAFRDQFNERQGKVVERIFREGVEGFKGGLNAEKYINLTKTSRATATRDLQDLVSKGVFSKTGTGKGTRYYLNCGGNRYDNRSSGVGI